MNHVLFGKTGIKVSELCLGTMTFGNEADEATSRKMMNRAFDAGINFFDTADVYAGGATEEIVGRWLKGKRDSVVLASKTHFPSGKGLNERGSSRLHIVRGVEASLARLNTDCLDILYLHHWDDNTELEQSLAAMDHLVQQGKVLYCAVSNFSAWQTVKALEAAHHRGLAPIVAVQPMYNLIKRVAEVEILPMAQHENLAVCPYSPIAAGLLTGKYHQKKRGRITSNPMYKERYKNPDYMDVAGRFVEYAQTRGLSPAALAVAWVASHPAVTSAIIGARTITQLETALTSDDIALDDAFRAEITALSADPPLATDREDLTHTHLPLREAKASK